MRWTLKAGNIVEEPADVLVCSANPHLTLSGGVGADLLVRYDSSPKVIEQTVTAALGMAAGYGAKRVALAALGTGFGHLSLAEFAEGVRPLLSLEIPPIDEVCVCLLEEYRVRELAEHLTEAAVVC